MIGENIKKLRTAAGLTQKELAEKLFVTAQAVSRWENKEVEPSATTIYEMSKIFNVSIDEIFGNSAPAPVVEKEIVVEKEYVYKEPKEIVAVCSQCNRAIYDESDMVRVTHGRTRSTYCKNCYEEYERARRENAQRDKEASVKHGVKQRTKSFILGGIITALVLALMIWVTSTPEFTAGDKALWIVFSIMHFPFVSCLCLRNNFVGDMMITIISWGFVKFPGIIFGLSIDGCIFFIAVKLLFWALGILLACLFTILAYVLGLIVSVFVYPFAIIKSFKHPEKTEKRI